jgi:hypothetical protein
MTGEFRQRGYVLLEALSTLQHHKAAIDPIYSCSLELPHLIVSPDTLILMPVRLIQSLYRLKQDIYMMSFKKLKDYVIAKRSKTS